MNATETGSLNVLTVDANATLRKGTELLLRSWGHHVIGSTGDADSGYHLVARRRPEVILVDQDLPGGLDLVRRIIEEDPDAAVVLHLGRPHVAEVEEAVGSGARGVVFKSAEPQELRKALEAAAGGVRYVAPAAERLLTRAGDGHARLLSPREREVLQLLAHGSTGEHASTLLSLSPETVRTHVRNASRRLGARTRVHAVTMAIAREEIAL